MSRQHVVGHHRLLDSRLPAVFGGFDRYESSTGFEATENRVECTMEGDEKQCWQEGPMETFDGVEAAEEERNVKESGPDRIDDAFQPPAARSEAGRGSPRG